MVGWDHELVRILHAPRETPAMVSTDDRPACQDHLGPDILVQSKSACWQEGDKLHQQAGVYSTGRGEAYLVPGLARTQPKHCRAWMPTADGSTRCTAAGTR